jgi:hypothetical protein
MTERYECIEVRVTFPISKKGAFEHVYPEDTTIGVALAAAMKHFEVEDDTQFTYVLTHEGLEQADAVTVGSLAGVRNRIHFALVKKITQG